MNSSYTRVEGSSWASFLRRGLASVMREVVAALESPLSAASSEVEWR